MTRDTAGAALDAVEAVLPPQRPVALHEPTLRGKEWEYVKECLDSGWVSTVGSFVTRFEQELAAYCGVRHAIAAVNGTAALHVAMMVAGVRAGDEVIVPALTFVGTVNAISYCGAIPHFSDVDRETLGLDPKGLARYLDKVTIRQGDVTINRETGRIVRALVMMHTFGHPGHTSALADICKARSIVFVEDAAEAIGSRRDGCHVGASGLVSCLSFNGNKIVTTGGGGAVLTNDADLARRARHLTTTARVPAGWEFDHDEVGYNYRLPNINAAMGCAQLEALPALLAAKRRLAEQYQAAFDTLAGVQFISEPPDTESNYWLCALLFDDPAQRDRFLEISNAKGIQTRPPWRPMHHLPMYAECPRMPLNLTEDLVRRIANIPSSPFLAPS